MFDMPTGLLLFIGIGIPAAFLVGRDAQLRGRSGAWGVWVLLIPPLLVVFLWIAMTDRQKGRKGIVVISRDPAILARTVLAVSLLVSAFLVGRDVTTPTHQESGAGWSAGLGGSCGNAFDAIDGGHPRSIQGFPPDAQAAFEQERALCRQMGGDRLAQAWWVIFGGSYVALLIVVVGKRRRKSDDDPSDLSEAGSRSDPPSAAFTAGHFVGSHRLRKGARQGAAPPEPVDRL